MQMKPTEERPIKVSLNLLYLEKMQYVATIEIRNPT